MTTSSKGEGMLPITTTTMYGTRDAKFERAIVDENTIKVIITEEPTRALNYKAIYWGSPENGELETLYVGPDFDEGEILDLITGAERMSMSIFVPSWVDQSLAMKINDRLARMHIKYLDEILYAVK